MKHTALVGGLLALAAVGALGCKSAPRTAWWKPNKATESTAVARSAPALPSDVAKKSEGAQLNAAQVAGGDAAPFKSTPAANATAVAAANFPKTNAPAFTPEVTGQIAGSIGASAAQQSSSASLGSIALPYNPSKAPQAKSTAAVDPAAPVATDRYASALGNVLPAYTGGAAPAYGQPASGNPADVAASTNATASAPPFAATAAQVNQAISAAPAAADRYATAATDAAKSAIPAVTGAASNAAASSYAAIEQAAAEAASYVPYRYGETTPTAVASSAPVANPNAPTTTVAAAQPYRPGGTSTYPTVGAQTTTQPSVQVASRPQTTTISVPNVAVPGAASTPSQYTTPSRY